MMEEDEKGAKLLLRRRAARTQMLTVLMGVGCLLTVTSVLTVKQLQLQHHSPKTRGGTGAAAAAAIRKDAVVEQETNKNTQQESLPANSIYRLSVRDANGVLRSLQRYAGMVTLVVNTACK
jgi:hypothetical protein